MISIGSTGVFEATALTKIADAIKFHARIQAAIELFRKGYPDADLWLIKLLEDK